MLAAGATLALLASVAEAAQDARLVVDYSAPNISVMANDVALLEVLQAIAAKVGFSVSEARTLSDRVTISIQDASVEDVLRRLLRAQNHTILYRQTATAEVVDRVVLLGLPGNGGPDVAGVPQVQAPSAAAAPPPVAAPRPPAVGSGPGAPSAGTPADQEEVTVGDMLRSHALSGAPAQAGSQPAAADAAAPTDVPQSLEESLAATTRRAQQGLSSLVEGLQRATEALQQAPTAPAVNPAPSR